MAILGVFAFFACESEEAQKAKEEQRLKAEARVEDYVQILERNCRERVLEAAIRIADSLLILEARMSTDTLFKPIKPIRPEKPETQILKDTTPIKPFLKRDTIKQ